jgi:hypothetical protein
MQAKVSPSSDIRRRLSKGLINGVKLLLSPIAEAISILLQLPFVQDISRLIKFIGKPIVGIVLIAVAALRAINQAAKWLNHKFGIREESVLSHRPFHTTWDNRITRSLSTKNLLPRQHRNDPPPSLEEGISKQQHTSEQVKVEKNVILKKIFKTQTMNEQNFEYLKKQLKHTGYGEEHLKDLREELKKQTPAFTLFHQADYGKDNIVGALHFKKSDTSDMVFFNRHTLILKSEKHPDTIRQTFYIDSGKDNVTLKEGYNLLSGRAVEKNLETKDGEKYRAWQQLNFKETDKHGNFITKQFHERYGFDLEKSLLLLPLKLENPDEKKRLMESLQRGNRQSVTLDIDGKERKIFVEAAPQFKSLNYYNEQGKRLQLQSVLQNPEQAFGERQSTKETKKQKAGKPDDDLEDKPKKRQSKRQGVSH